MLRFFLSERCLYLIVYDGRSETRNRLNYWLDHMKNYGGESKAFILINCFDEHTPKIPIRALKEDYPIELVETFSIKDDKEALLTFRNKVVIVEVFLNEGGENITHKSNGFLFHQTIHSRLPDFHVHFFSFNYYIPLLILNTKGQYHFSKLIDFELLCLK